MNQTITIPWSVGDTCWAILTRSVKENISCDKCLHTSQKSTVLTEVRECQIDSISVDISDGVMEFWYRVGFDIGESDPKCGRFTYGTHAPKVWASREEAEESISKETDHR